MKTNLIEIAVTRIADRLLEDIVVCPMSFCNVLVTIDRELVFEKVDGTERTPISIGNIEETYSELERVGVDIPTFLAALTLALQLFDRR